MNSFLRGSVGLALGCAVKRGGHTHTQHGGQGTRRLEGVPCGMDKALVRGGVDIQAWEGTLGGIARLDD